MRSAPGNFVGEIMKSKLFALHGLRAVAATMVALTHLLLRLIKYEVVGPQWEKFTILGSAGVYTFFAISGFIMFKASKNEFGLPNSPQRFFLRRLIRVLPIYYIFTILFVVKLVATSVSVSANEIALSLAFIPYLGSSGLMQPIYSLGWTLNYEMYFYAVFAVCLFFPRPVGPILLFAAIGAVVLSSQFINGHSANGDPQSTLAFYGHPIVLFFLAGMAIAMMPIRYQLSPTLALLMATALLIIGVVTGNALILAATCLAAVYIVALERMPASPSTSERGMEVLGEASYSIYLTHSFVLGPMVAIGLKLGLLSGLSAWLFSVLTIGIVVAIGLLSYLAIERPVLAFLRSRLLRPKSASSPRSV